jgi:glycerophosphoryl diester phosphodiesterase
LLDGVAYTNSPDALNQNYESGRRIFEIDLALTSDDHIVLAHDWDAYGGKAPDRATFLTDGTFTRLDFSHFIDSVGQTCPDCRIVTDTKFEFEQFWKTYSATVPPEMQRDQFVLQTYDFATAQSLAARTPTQPQILTLHLLESVAEADLAVLDNVPSLIAVTMPLDRVPFQSSQVQAATGKPAFSQGYPWMMRSQIVLRLARAFGVTGFYKD